MAAKHFDANKPDLSQLPRAALELAARVMMMGEKKYGKGNYLAGMDWTKLMSSTLRHCYKWLDCEDLDDESGLSHLGHAIADLCMLVTIIEHGRGADDRPRCPKDEVTDATEEHTEERQGLTLEDMSGAIVQYVNDQAWPWCPP